MPMAAISAALPPVSHHLPMISWGVPCDQLSEEVEARACVQMALPVMQAPLQWPMEALHPLSKTALKGDGKGKSLQWAKLQTVNLRGEKYILPERKNGQMCDCTLIHKPWPVVWMDGHELGMNTTGKFMTKK